MGRIKVRKIPMGKGKVAPHIFRKRVAKATKWMSRAAVKKLGLSRSFVPKALARKGTASLGALGGVVGAVGAARAGRKMYKAGREIAARRKFRKKWKFGVTRKRRK